MEMQVRFGGIARRPDRADTIAKGDLLAGLHGDALGLEVGIERELAIAVVDQTREVQELTSTRFGGTGRAGLELALGSRLGARLEAAARINTRGFYAPDEGNVVYWDFDRRRDSFSSAGVRLGLVAMF